MDEMAKEEGFDSFADMIERGANDAYEEGRESETPEADYAAVCGAPDAEVSGGEPYELEKDIVLHFESFDAPAYRRVIASDVGFGLAVMYGTDLWINPTRSQPVFMDLFGLQDMYSDTKGWLDFAYSGGGEAYAVDQEAQEYPAQKQEENWNP